MRDEEEPLAMEVILGTPPAPAAGTSDLKTLSRILGVAGSIIPGVSAGSVLLDWAIEKRQPTIKETLEYWDGVLIRFEDRLDEEYLQSKDGVGRYRHRATDRRALALRRLELPRADDRGGSLTSIRHMAR